MKMWGVVCLMLVVLGMQNVGAKEKPQVPCYFIFGDSLVDNGNNNVLPSLARADYLPYGIDYSRGPTGRFCNGKTAVDFLAEFLGFDSPIGPYSRVRGDQILRGVNFASAAAGIRRETGRQLGARITFRGQVNNYKRAVSRVENLLGKKSAAKHLGKCIYSIGMGSNDYLNNYFQPLYYNTANEYTPEEYAKDLISRYSEQLKRLHNYGARKFVLFGIGQIGCSPNQLAQSPDGKTCVKKVNDANEIFNKKLISLVDKFNNQYTDAKYIYINSFGINEDLLSNPGSYGLRVTKKGCCGVGRNNGQVTCLPAQTPCPNRKEYLFWDAFHPTEVANDIISRRAYKAKSKSDAHPYDISQLAKL